jgi:hypothetical protein
MEDQLNISREKAEEYKNKGYEVYCKKIQYYELVPFHFRVLEKWYIEKCFASKEASSHYTTQSGYRKV